MNCPYFPHCQNGNFTSLMGQTPQFFTVSGISGQETLYSSSCWIEVSLSQGPSWMGPMEARISTIFGRTQDVQVLSLSKISWALTCIRCPLKLINTFKQLSWAKGVWKMRKLLQFAGFLHPPPAFLHKKKIRNSTASCVSSKENRWKAICDKGEMIYT